MSFVYKAFYFVSRWRPMFISFGFLLPLVIALLWYNNWFGNAHGLPLAELQGETSWGDMFTMLSALFAGVSILSFVHLHESKTVNSFQHSYAKPKMARALRTLVDYRTSNRKYFRMHRVSSSNSNERLALPGVSAPAHWSEAVTDARRHIKFYFSNALGLYVSGAISLAAFRRIVDKSAICVFFEIVEPIEAMLNPFYNQTPYYKLMLLCSDLYNQHREHDYISGGSRSDTPESVAATFSGVGKKGRSCPCPGGTSYGKAFETDMCLPKGGKSVVTRQKNRYRRRALKVCPCSLCVMCSCERAGDTDDE